MSEKIMPSGEDSEKRLIARSPVPEGIEEEYGGQWVLLRNGQVFASSNSVDELFKTEDYEPMTDAVYRVPEPGVNYYYYAA